MDINMRARFESCVIDGDGHTIVMILEHVVAAPLVVAQHQ